MKRDSSQKWYFAMLLFCVVSGLLTLTFIYLFLTERSDDQRDQKKLSEAGAIGAARSIDEHLVGIEPLVFELVAALADGPMESEVLNDKLESSFKQNANLLEVGIAYIPSNPDSPEPRAPHYGLKGDVLGPFPVQYDYWNFPWFKNTISKEKEHWFEPYFGLETQKHVAGFAAPFYHPDPSTGEPALAGVVRANFSLERIQAIVDELDLDKTGFGVLLTGKATIIAHPDQAYVKKGLTLFELAEENAGKASAEEATHSAEAKVDEALWELAERVTRSERGFVDYRNKVNGQSSWIFNEPIDSNDWSIGVVFIKDELLAIDSDMRHEIIWITVLSLAFSLSLAIVILRAHEGAVHRLWGVVIIFSLFCTLGLGGIWRLALVSDKEQRHPHTKIVSHAVLQKFLAGNVINTDLENPPVYIPTGVFIQSIEFATALNVVVTGYIWQKYEKCEDDPSCHDSSLEHTHSCISQGFVLPEAESFEKNIAYRREDGNSEIIGWYFQATLRQDFDYSKYPFDQERVWIRIWHKDFDRNVVLTPDLDSYSLTNPTSRPGIEENFVLDGWSMTRSFFSYVTHSYNTDFGIKNYVGQKKFPELYFNMELRRKFLNPFISNIIPLMVVAVMAFGVLLIITKRDGKVDLLGFNTAAVLSFCAALFFVALLSHIDLRGKLPAEEIVYLEYFYLATYMLLLAVFIDAILFIEAPNLWFVQYRDNLIPALLYWPVFLGTLFGFTAFAFY